MATASAISIFYFPQYSGYIEAGLNNIHFNTARQSCCSILFHLVSNLKVLSDLQGKIIFIITAIRSVASS